MTELVVLVDDNDQPIGTMPKSEVHGTQTPLHRAFSCFVFNSKGQLLLQQRASSKKTWPLVWSNSCCGHPMPDESREDACKRRLRFELGMPIDQVELVAPYQYCFSKDGVMENEICPILVAFTNIKPNPNPEEVEAVKYMHWTDFITLMKTEGSGGFSPWCVEETLILENNQRFNHLYENFTQN
jgi:isopentenyl-diphosphate delta-isomerase